MQKALAVVFVLALSLAALAPAAAQTAGEPEPTLQAIASKTAPFMGGGAFTMGTNQSEVQAALDACEPADGCDEALASDSLVEHQVPVGRYQIELFEVSNAQYSAFLNALGADSHLSACQDAPCALTQAEDAASNIVFDGAAYTVVEGAENLPVTFVSWYGAQAYCEALGRRLPTEAEWELAARGPLRIAYPWGNEFDPTVANTARSESGGLAPVDAYPEGASVYGAYHMAGNVAEWVLDWYASDFYETDAAIALNPTGPASGTERVVRGGSWQDAPFYVRAVQRASLPPDTMTETVGFRCALDGWPLPDPPSAALATVYEGIESGVQEDGAPYLGSLDAPVELTEFFQFTCPHCNNFRATLKELLPYVREGQVRFVSRPLPSSSQLSIAPIFVTLCAVDQGAYWPLHDYFFQAYFEVEGGIAYTLDRLLDRAEVFGLDMDLLEACLSSEDRLLGVEMAVTQSGMIASEKGVTGVPTVLLNGDFITSPDGNPMSGALPLPTLQIAINEALGAAEGE